MTAGTALTAGVDLYELITAYEEKKAAIPAALAAAKEAESRLSSVCHTMGAYGGGMYSRSGGGFSWVEESALLHCLRRSSWRYVYDALRIKEIAPATHIKELDALLDNPPEFDEGNLRGVFRGYVLDPRRMALQALAEVFCNLDRFFRSHDNIKIGRKGMPKRVILQTYQYSRGGWDCVADVANALHRWRRKPELLMTGYQYEDFIKKHGDEWREGLRMKLHGNGRVHIFFDDDALDDINRALAEWYGEVLPDAYEHTAAPSASTEVSKDLQFYRTPADAAARLVRDIRIDDGDAILEPSCGDGALLDALRKHAADGYRHPRPSFSAIGVEVYAERAAEARAKGYAVHCGNFLEWRTAQRFNTVVMNPPFYGKHYAKHIRRAFDLLKPGGALHAILPVTARDNHGLLDDLSPRWEDLPVGSFKESGTCINTVIMRCYKK